jgi:hypothetical protein
MIDEKPGKVKETGHPGDDGHHMERFHPKVTVCKNATHQLHLRRSSFFYLEKTLKGNDAVGPRDNRISQVTRLFVHKTNAVCNCGRKMSDQQKQKKIVY